MPRFVAPLFASLLFAACTTFGPTEGEPVAADDAGLPGVDARPPPPPPPPGSDASDPGDGAPPRARYCALHRGALACADYEAGDPPERIYLPRGPSTLAVENGGLEASVANGLLVLESSATGSWLAKLGATDLGVAPPSTIAPTFTMHVDVTSVAMVTVLRFTGQATKCTVQVATSQAATVCEGEPPPVVAKLSSPFKIVVSAAGVVVNGVSTSGPLVGVTELAFGTVRVGSGPTARVAIADVLVE